MNQQQKQRNGVRKICGRRSVRTIRIRAAVQLLRHPAKEIVERVKLAKEEKAKRLLPRTSNTNQSRY